MEPRIKSQMIKIRIKRKNKKFVANLIKHYLLKALLNKCVLISFLKTVQDCVDLMLDGSSFQSLGPTTLNALEANVDFLVNGSTSTGYSFEVDLVTLTDSFLDSKDDRQSGAVLQIHLNTKQRILCWILSATGSQCKVRRASVELDSFSL